MQILTISLDTPDESRLMAEEISKYPGPLDFPLLSDTEHRVVDRYGIYHPAEVKPGIPYTVTYVLNKEGLVVHRFYDDHGHRPSNEQIHEQLKAAGAVN